MKRLGPALKTPDLKNLKVPPALRDLYQDLRDRRLLPLLALGLVALVAIPIMLSDPAPTPSPPPTPPPAADPGAAASASASRLTVVKAAPGLREPRKRLAHLDPKDPFVQHYTNTPVSEESTPVVTASSSTVESPTTTAPTEAGSAPGATAPTEESGPPGNGNGSPGNGNGPGTKDGIVFYSFAIDLRVIRTETKPNGGKERDEPTVQEGVLPSSAVPGEKAQVLTYMGVSPKTRKPLFLVSEEVSAVYGDAKCVAGVEVCQLIELDPQIPETFVFGANDVRYKVNVLKVEPVVTGHS
jgi:hypothetical protein